MEAQVGIFNAESMRSPSSRQSLMVIKMLRSIIPVIQRPWFITFLLLGVFFITVGYKYGWDDQHVEIPLLKSLIDSDLYVGDYYVESLKKNFTSYFYIFLSKIITVEQVPDAYFMLFCISRYFLLYWIYKLWLHLSQSRFKAIACVLVFMYVVRVEEFLYRTFSHQEFALAIIFAGIYYFFKERYILSSLLLGVSVNFHALYALFPFFYMFLYLLWDFRKVGIKKIGLSFISFVFVSLPFIFWVLGNRIEFGSTYTGTFKGWLNLYHYICPQNFFFPPVDFALLIKHLPNFFELNKTYLFLLALFILNLILNQKFKANKKALFFSLGAMILLAVSFLFTYLYPVRFVLDLNLTRNSQYLHFLLIGYTTLFVIEFIDKKDALMAFSAGTLFAFLKFYKAFVVLPALGALFSLALFARFKKKDPGLKKNVLISLSLILLMVFLYYVQFLYTSGLYKYSIMITLLMIFIGNTCGLLFVKLKDRKFHRIFILIPLIFYLGHYGYYNWERQKQEDQGDGFWRLRRNWIDMQLYVKEKTPVESKILVPHDIKMGGFRIHSERSVIFSERDCGIIGFDYLAALEWLKRYKQMEDFRSSTSTSIFKSLEVGIFGYKADYVVFMRYFMPRENELLQRVYTNTDFALYKVTNYGNP